MTRITRVRGYSTAMTEPRERKRDDDDDDDDDDDGRPSSLKPNKNNNQRDDSADVGDGLDLDADIRTRHLPGSQDQVGCTEGGTLRKRFKELNQKPLDF